MGTNLKPVEFDRLYDGQRRIEDKVTEIAVKLAAIPDHAPRITLVEQGLVEAKVGLGQVRLAGLLIMPLLAAAISVAVHFILKGF
jgi:hypothetical protein